MVMAPEGRVETRPERTTLRSRRLTPERLPVEIDGRDMPLQAWVVRNMRYPASISGELEDARLEWEATRVLVAPEDAEPVPKLLEAVEELIRIHDEGQPLERLTESVQVLKAAVEQQKRPVWRSRAVDFEAYVTRCLMILIPGLERWEADMLEPDDRLGWLRELGYFRPNSQPLEANPTLPPEPSPSSTGDEQGPGSDASTE